MALLLPLLLMLLLLCDFLEEAQLFEHAEGAREAAVRRAVPDERRQRLLRWRNVLSDHLRHDPIKVLQLGVVRSRMSVGVG